VIDGEPLFYVNGSSSYVVDGGDSLFFTADDGSISLRFGSATSGPRVYLKASIPAYGSIHQVNSSVQIAQNATIPMDAAGENRNVTASTTAYTLTISQAGVYQIAYGGTVVGTPPLNGNIKLMNTGTMIDQAVFYSPNSEVRVFTGKVYTAQLGAGSALRLVNGSANTGTLTYRNAYIEVVKLSD
jgi:hypothetical protein